MARAHTTDLQILIAPGELAGLEAAWQQRLADAGVDSMDVHAEAISLSCEPDNMLVTEYESRHGNPPVAEVVHRIIANGSSDLEDRAVTHLFVDALPEGTPWYGSTTSGFTDPGVTSACNISL